MAGPNQITGDTRFSADVSFDGTISSFPSASISNAHISTTAAIATSKIAQRPNAVFVLEAQEWRVHDALQTLLPTTSAADDLGITIGTFGTNAPYIGTSDLKAAGATTRYARIIRRLPYNYEAAESVTLRAYAGMITTVADTSATVDFEVYEIGASATPSSDLCATAAQSINSLTAADKDFTITATALNPGDLLDIRVTVAVNDAASGTAVIAALFKLSLLCDLRG